MSGWSGGVANRTWQRTTRKDSSASGRISLTEDVQRILAKFRDDHGWQEGMVWDPYRAEYDWPVPR